MLRIRHLLPALALSLGASAAQAHISLEQAGTHKSRNGDQFIKEGPCGKAGSVRGENVYEYSPGETISIEVKEFIPHPGYFRIAFDDDGDDAFEDPQSINPPYRDCLDDPKDHCGADDFYNNESVLMDELDMHNNTESKGTYTWDVKLPNVQCENCTLQIIQVMEDVFPIHAPFTPGEEDIYYQCIDLTLSGPLEPGADAGAGPAEPGPKDSKDSGCSVGHARSGSGGVAAALAALTLLVTFRRRK